jgi:hypothetical protein
MILVYVRVFAPYIIGTILASVVISNHRLGSEVSLQGMDREVRNIQTEFRMRLCRILEFSGIRSPGPTKC